MEGSAPAGAADGETAGTLRVAGGQIENAVGDLDGNVERIREAMAWAAEQEADVLLLPELALTGYPLSDLAVRRDFVEAAAEALEALAADSGPVATVVGTIDSVPPRRSWDTRERNVAIGASVICNGEVRGTYHKILLPNYEVFDEARNFAPGQEPGKVWRIGEAVVGISICEDSWSSDGPPESQAAAGAQLLLIQNASPFHLEKPAGRRHHCNVLARRNGMAVAYVNCVGGQDELVFDGGSLIVGSDGSLLHLAGQFESELFCVDVPLAPERQNGGDSAVTVHARPLPRTRPPVPSPGPARRLDDIEQVWRALVLGTRDFARRNGTEEAVLGMSGGIDAAVTATVAVDALGPERVLGLSMPTSLTPTDETTDAKRLAETLGMTLETVHLDALIESVGSGLAPILEGRPPAGGVRRDLVARVRGTLLQAVSDQLGHLALATVNKTELSLGSTTLYGDMSGAFAPLKDCPKTLLYELARYRNERDGTIPEHVIERTPSTLVADALALNSYETIDPILERRLEHGAELAELVDAGFDAELSRGVLQLLDDSELQRRQAPPGVKITVRAFGTDRRMPITNAWRPYRRSQERLAPGVMTGPVHQPGSLD